MSEERLNAYRVMWLFVFFDLPTATKQHRKAAAQFRKNLMKDGFTMMQFSVYIRHCGSRESAEVHSKRIQQYIPAYGQVSLLAITDKQYSGIQNFWGKVAPNSKDKVLPSPYVQLELF